MLRPGHLAVLPCLLLLAACGLEKIPYLSPPEGGGISGYAFNFTRLAENSESGPNYQFEGFELYYKFYTTDESPNAGIVNQSQFASAGFKRVCGDPPELHNNISKPLIKVAVAGQLTFTLNFAASPEPTATSTGISAVMRRIAYYASSHPLKDQFKSFAYGFTTTEPYLEGDEDVGAAIWGVIDRGTPSSNVRMALYVLSYGRQDFVTDLYSDAVYLGYIDINLGWSG